MKNIFRIVVRHQLIKAFLAVAIIGAVAFTSYWVGTTRPETVLVKGVTNIENDPKLVADFGVFWEAWDRLRTEALKGADLKESRLVYGAIDGIVRTLDDPNSVFFPPADAQKFEEDVTGNFGGIGAEIASRDDIVVVIAPLKDSPAEYAGVRSGDKIIKVGDTSTNGMKVMDAVKIIRGPKGTTVTLQLFREGWDKPKDVSIVRDTIIVPTMDWKMLDEHIGYIRIMSFNENAPKLLYRAAKELLDEGLNGIILDVRDNPGGFLEVAVNLAGWFMEKGSVVVTEEFRSDAAVPRQQFRANGNAVFALVPVVVLTNQGSASASEILAGALRDNRNAKLVGEKSFGKGTVQELKRLHDGSSMKLTIAHWLLPKGDLIEKNGIKPDYEVKISDDDIKNKKDPQLEKAREVMRGLVEKAMAQQ